MNAVIYGRPQCQWCDKAKDLAVRENIDYTYIDIKAAGIDGAKLSKICGKTIETVPQIFVDGVHIGGFDDFSVHLERNEVENPKMDYFVRERGEGDWQKSTFERYMQSKPLYEMDYKKELKAE